MKVLVLMFFCCAAAARSGRKLNYDHSWTPNVENVYKYTSPELIQALRNPVQPSTSIVRHPLILTAEVKVQAFADQSLRLKLDHIRFYSNKSQISLKNAHQTLKDEISNPEGMSHNAQTFKTYLKTPILVHLKRGVVKKVIVSQNEPAEVTEIKKQLVSDLEKSGSQARLQLLMTKAIIKPLETPRFPMRVDLGGYAIRVGIENNGESLLRMEEGFESGSRNITQENIGGHGPRLEPAYAFTCPDRCTTCKTGGSDDGGLPVNSNGFCEHFCSYAGYCGIGDKYNENNDGVDCSSCKSSDTCWSEGYGIGGTMKYLGTVSYRDQCKKMVMNKEPSANGVTIQDLSIFTKNGARRYCFAQFNMTSVNDDFNPLRFQTCHMCKTVGGPSWNSYCAFPFIYKNITYNECAYDELEGFWCPTANNVNLRNNTGWGICDSKCPLTDAKVKKIQARTLCKDMGLFEITSKFKCMQAASKLGLKWAQSFNGPNGFPGCFYAEYGRKKVYYNLSPNPGRTKLSPKYAAICKISSVVQQDLPARLCSSDGLNDIDSAVNCEAAGMNLYPQGFDEFLYLNDSSELFPPRCTSFSEIWSPDGDHKFWRFGYFNPNSGADPAMCPDNAECSANGPCVEISGDKYKYEGCECRSCVPKGCVYFLTEAECEQYMGRIKTSPGPKPNPKRDNYAICEDNIHIESECPRNKDLPVLKEGFGSGKEDQFYCAFTWNKRGDNEPMRGCNGQKRIWMDNQDYNGKFAGSMVSVGSVVVKAGCTLYGYSDYDNRGDVVKYSGPATWPNACGKYCPKVSPIYPHGGFANGYRSVQCRCKQDPIICQPYDEWVRITQYINKLDVESTFEYTKEIGTTWSSQATKSFKVSGSVEASMSYSFFKMIDTSLKISGTTGYDWGKLSTQAKSTKQTFKITVTVPPRTLLLISGVEANCGSNNIKTELFKAEGLDTEGNSKYTRYDDTIPSKSEQILISNE